MPVREVAIDGERGYRWGEAGAFYAFDPGDETSRERARAKAELQGEVIQRRRAAASGLSFVPPKRCAPLRVGRSTCAPACRRRAAP